MKTKDEHAQLVIGLFNKMRSHFDQNGEIGYRVVPSKEVHGASFEEVKEMSFDVGLPGDVPTTLDVQELAAVYLLIRKYNAAIQGGDPKPDADGKRRFKFDVDYRMSDEMLQEGLRVVDFEPVGDYSANDQDVSRERIEFLGNLMGTKVLNGSFKIYPPESLFDNPSLAGFGLYSRFRNTRWWIRWSKGGETQLTFAELMVFIFQLLAFKKSVERLEKKMNSMSVDDFVAGKVSISGEAEINTRQILSDNSIRSLFEKVELQPNARPKTLLN